MKKTFVRRNKPSALDLNRIYEPIAVEINKTRLLYEDILASQDSFVNELIVGLNPQQGKYIRAALVILSFRICERKKSSVQSSKCRQVTEIAQCVELLHLATLIHDDIIDQSALRRGIPSLNKSFGNEISVLMGDFVFSRAVGFLARYADQEIMKVLAKATDNLIEGEIKEVRSRFRVDQSEQEYIEILEKKTASLISAACESGAVVAGAGKEKRKFLAEFGYNIGTVFQIQDDILDLRQSTYRLGKPAFQDLREGKLTLPFLKALSNCEQSEKIKYQSLFLKNELEDDDIERILVFIQRQGGFEKAREKCEVLKNKAIKSLDSFSDTPYKKGLLKLADYIYSREF
jgi:octaprenyl-diphosphate synthase